MISGEHFIIILYIIQANNNTVLVILSYSPVYPACSRYFFDNFATKKTANITHNPHEISDRTCGNNRQLIIKIITMNVFTSLRIYTARPF